MSAIDFTQGFRFCVRFSSTTSFVKLGLVMQIVLLKLSVASQWLWYCMFVA